MMTKTQEKEFILMKAAIDWMKKKMIADSKVQKEMKENLSLISGVLLKNEKTGFEGYFALTRQLIKNDILTNKRIDKLETVKKFIWTSMVIGSGAIGWVLKVIYDKI